MAEGLKGKSTLHFVGVLREYSLRILVQSAPIHFETWCLENQAPKE